MPWQRRAPFVTVLLVILLSLMTLNFLPTETAVAAAGGETPGSLGIIGKDGSVKGACPLRHTEVRAAISGFLARVTVTQTFENSATQKIEGRVAQAFDLADITTKVGAPSFAHFAKGGCRKCSRKWVDHQSGVWSHSALSAIQALVCAEVASG